VKPSAEIAFHCCMALASDTQCVCHPALTDGQCPIELLAHVAWL